jgi:mRNA interferase YafQ
MYKIEYDQDFQKSFKKVIGKNAKLLKKLKHCIETLAKDPFYPSLRSHKVDTIFEENVYSSWVTGDIRIIWKNNSNNEAIILCIRLGKHSGSNQIYKQKSS